MSVRRCRTRPLTGSRRGEARLTWAQGTVLAKDPKALQNPEVPLASPQGSSIVLSAAFTVSCSVGPQFFSDQGLGPADFLVEVPSCQGYISWRSSTSRHTGSGHIPALGQSGVTELAGPHLLPGQAGTRASLVRKNWTLSLVTPRGEAVRRVREGFSAVRISSSVTLGRIT